MLLTPDAAQRVRPYPLEYFVTLVGRFSGHPLTTGFPGIDLALQYALETSSDPLFVVPSFTFDWHVTFYVISRDEEMTAKFNAVAGARQFIEMADTHHDLVAIEDNLPR